MFQIHPQLLKDCHRLGKLNSSHCLLHKNALLHWFILVPETEHKNLLELEETALSETMKNAQLINQYLLNSLGYKKTNFASIGNLVDQLHLHIIGRREDDTCWPQPVWGNLHEHKDYQPEQIERIKQELLSGKFL